MNLNYDKNDFYNTICYVFQGKIYQNSLEAIFDENSQCLVATDKYAKLYGHDSYKSILGKNIDYFMRVDYKLDQNHVAHKCLVILQFNDTIYPLQNTFFPFFFPDGKFAGYRLLAREFKHILYADLIENTETKTALKPPQLTAKQHAVLFLLIFSYSQEDIALSLGITRGGVTRMINDSICPKFNISGSNTKYLIKEAIRYGFHKQIPSILLKPQIIYL